MATIRAALFTDSDAFAGTERHMLDLARGLRDGGGVSASLACPAQTPIARKAAEFALPVIAIAKNGLVDFRAVKTLRGMLRAGELEIIHAHNGRTALVAAMAVATARRGASVMTQHFIEPNHASLNGPKAFAFKIAHRWVNRRTGHFIAISQAVLAAMQNRGEAKNGKVTVVSNGMLPPDPARLTAPELVREELGIGHHAPLLVCAARLEQEKDVRSLIAAMPAVLAKCPDAMCVIAGQGAERQALQAQAEALGISRSVKLLGFREDAPAIIGAGDVFVLPSPAEPFGLVLLEAMALGKSLVAIREGGPGEIVLDGETGLLVAPAAPEMLAAALVRLLREPGTREEMGRRGRLRFQQEYSVEKMAAATLAVYKIALAGV